MAVDEPVAGKADFPLARRYRIGVRVHKGITCRELQLSGQRRQPLRGKGPQLQVEALDTVPGTAATVLYSFEVQFLLPADAAIVGCSFKKELL